MTTTALAPWFGSNRMLAQHVGAELAGCKWVGIPFAGGFSELVHINARSVMVNDLHRHLMNLARVVNDPVLGPTLYRKLRSLPFHPDVLATAQQRCMARDAAIVPEGGDLFSGPAPAPRHDAEPDIAWAMDYFVAVWMARSGDAGTAKEFAGGLSARWNANGGDSATRFRSAARSLVEWRKLFHRNGVNFSTIDAFAFIGDMVDDADGHGLYCDPPFPGPGDAYKHTFGEAGQRRLAASVGRFKATRVVMRFYDHPLVRELYPEGRWTWVRRTGRKQTNGDAPEVLLINGPSLAAGGAR